MKRFITITSKIRQSLILKYKVSRQAVWKACTFEVLGGYGSHIRKDALEMGGTYHEEGFSPCCSVEVGDMCIDYRFATGVVVHQTDVYICLQVPGLSDTRYVVTPASLDRVLKEAQRIAGERMIQSLQ